MKSHWWLRVAKILPVDSFEAEDNNDWDVRVIQEAFKDLVALVGKFFNVLDCFLHLDFLMV